MQNSIFIAQESSQYLGFKKDPYVNMIDFFNWWDFGVQPLVLIPTVNTYLEYD